MKRLAAAVLALALFTPAPQANAGSDEATVDDLAWMAGYWTDAGDGGAPVVEELWLRPAGGRVMVGVHRDARNIEQVFFEYLRIETRSDGVYYVSRPSNQSEAAFRLVELEGGATAVFENPGHDFPQRITYRLDGDVLSAIIGGTIGGEEKSASWSFKRTPFDRETK